MKRYPATLFKAILLCFVGVFASGQCTQHPILVNVTDSQGQRASGLKAEDFSINLDGKDVKVTFSTPPASPRVLLVLNKGRGMQGVPGMLGVQDYGTSNLLLLLPKNIPVALAVYADDLQLISDFGFDREAQIDALRRFNPQSIVQKRATSQVNALKKALELLGTPQPGDSIVLVTNGIDNRPSSELDALEKTIESEGVRVFFYGLIKLEVGVMDTYGSLTLEEYASEEHTSRFASSSGGIGLKNESIEDSKKSPERFTEISRGLAWRIISPYALELVGVSPSTDLKKLKVKLDTKISDKFKQFRVESPERIAICSKN